MLSGEVFLAREVDERLTAIQEKFKEQESGVGLSPSQLTSVVASPGVQDHEIDVVEEISQIFQVEEVGLSRSGSSGASFSNSA